MPDGSRWDVPCEIIAANRANYYSPEKSAPLWEREYQYALKNNDEIEDWAANNMNWDDVKADAKRVQEPPPSEPDWQEGWVNGDREVVELP